MDEPGGEISLSSLEQGDTGRHEVPLRHSTSSKDSIFRIPGLFKMRNGQAYTPYKFSIGPWHFSKRRLLRTGQNLKECFLERLIHRFPNPEEKKRELKKVIEYVHDRARECYEGGDVYEGKNMERVDELIWDSSMSTKNISFKSLEYSSFKIHEREIGPNKRKKEKKNVAKEEFEKILLLDGCFIYELFRENDENVRTQRNESVLFSEGMIQVIYHDLLLLDNQIPWFVLEFLYYSIGEYPNEWNSTLVRQASKFFSRAISHNEEVPTIDPAHFSNSLHLVDFVWRFLCFSSATEKLITTLEYGTPIPSASRLKEGGVKFQKATSTNILDVKFNEGVLEIPRLLVTPSTETIFRNLIIFEQCSLPSIPRVTCYAVLLDCLVDTSDDVDLMCRAEILDNWLNPEETANFLNRVRDNTPIKEFLYAELCKDVNRYCKRRWPRWRASLIHNYFTKPWAIVSVVFATIVLFFTIMQVFY